MYPSIVIDVRGRGSINLDICGNTLEIVAGA
jgi:hypothetical protein